MRKITVSIIADGWLTYHYNNNNEGRFLITHSLTYTFTLWLFDGFNHAFYVLQFLENNWKKFIFWFFTTNGYALITSKGTEGGGKVDLPILI